MLNKSIYPSQTEFREATEKYLFDNHEDYINQFNKDTWTITYEQHFYKDVSFDNFALLLNF